ncbi:MAG: archease [Phycisphaerae bacterium]
MRPSFELFDHTADLGIRVRAPALAELLQPAADGLYAAIGRLLPGGVSASVTLELTGDEAAVLLRDFLDELLILVERDGRIATGHVGTAFDDHRLHTTVRTARIDPERSVFDREVKAVTYHQLAIQSIPGGVEATLIVDI